MADVAVPSFKIYPYPYGHNDTQQRTSLQGTCVINAASGNVAPITAYSITSDVVTFTAANSFNAGDVVYLSGFPTATFFNGHAVTVLSTGLSGTAFEADFTHANASATEAGVATPTGEYVTGGLPVTWFPMTNSSGGTYIAPTMATNPIGGAAQLYSLTDSGYEYSYNPGTLANGQWGAGTLRIYTIAGVELANGAGIPAAVASDTIEFTAQFIKNLVG